MGFKPTATWIPPKPGEIRQHKRLTHGPEGCMDLDPSTCSVCNLFICSVCGQAEAELAKSCPGPKAEAHSNLSPSAAKRWTSCPGSVRLCRTVPEPPPGPYAIEGTRLHNLADKLLKQGSWPSGSMTPADAEILEPYLEFVASLDGDKATEQKVRLQSVSKDIWGTADVLAYNQRRLTVGDLKTGNTIVSPVENPQLMIYAGGAIETHDLTVSEIELVIAQPRAFHPEGPIRRWQLSAADLIDWLAWLKEKVEATEDTAAPLCPGDHCQWCPAAAICPALREQNTALAVIEFAPVDNYDPVQLSQMLDAVPRIDAWCRSLERFAQNELESGRPVPGWKLVAKRATRQWAKGDDETLAKFEELGIDPSSACDSSVRSPAQIEKLLPKDRRKELSPLIVSRSSGSTLAPESDPRKPVRSPAERAALEFTSVEQPTDTNPKQE